MPDLEWPRQWLDPADALRWISAALPAGHGVAGPTRIERVSSFAVTARFAVSSPAAPPVDVVFKASTLPLFGHAPNVDRLLMHCCPGETPELIASRNEPGRVWCLYRAFQGTEVADLNSLDALLQMARQFARLQVAVAQAAPADRAGIPRVDLTELPAQFDRVLQDVVDKQWPLWQARHVAEQGIPADLVARLTAQRPRFSQWVDALTAMQLPDTIDHVDLHSSNAVLTPQGRVLIYDWTETLIGPPHVSLDRLLDDAREIDEQAGRVARHAAVRYSPSELAVRDAYLGSLPWGSLAEREDAFDLALCLAPIKTAHEGRVFAQAQGWANGVVGQAAMLLAKTCRRWSTFA